VPRQKILPASIAECRSHGAATPSQQYLIALGSSRIAACVRVTGDAALSGVEGTSVGRRLAEGLGGAGTEATVIAGCSMSVSRPSPGHCATCPECAAESMYCDEHSHLVEAHQRDGVMSVLPALAQMGSQARTVGIAPTIGRSLEFCGGHFVVSNHAEKDYYTVVDRRCPVCLLLYFSTDNVKLDWNIEWQISLDYLQLLREQAGFRTSHLVAGGGKYARNELDHVSQLEPRDNPWNILLIKDSGRLAQELAADADFRRGKDAYIWDCTWGNLAQTIYDTGFSRVAPPKEGSCQVS
jgi:hypothetical protein